MSGSVCVCVVMCMCACGVCYECVCDEHMHTSHGHTRHMVTCTGHMVTPVILATEFLLFSGSHRNNVKSSDPDTSLSERPPYPP